MSPGKRYCAYGILSRGQDKPGGDILPQGKVSPGTRYHMVSCPWRQDTGGQDKERKHDQTYEMSCVPSEDSDQPTHLHIVQLDQSFCCRREEALGSWLPIELIWVFAGCTSWQNQLQPYANNKNSDQLAHPCSLNRAYGIGCWDDIIIPIDNLSKMPRLSASIWSRAS